MNAVAAVGYADGGDCVAVITLSWVSIPFWSWFPGTSFERD
jgi:hypothetical protein